MLEQLVEIDRSLMYLVNRTWANAFFDFLLPILRNVYTWIPLYIGLIALVFYKYKRAGWIILIFTALTITLSDRSSAGVFKPGFQRLRPCHHPTVQQHITLRLKSCGGRYGFVSSHAANHFALALFLSMVLRRKIASWAIAALFFWAAAIGYAQIYVGVHYPADVLGGAVLGCLIGYLCARVCKIALQKLTGPDPV